MASPETVRELLDALKRTLGHIERLTLTDTTEPSLVELKETLREKIARIEAGELGLY